MATLYCRTDIHAILVALAVQSVATYAADGQHNAEYIRGSLDTIRAVALGHGCIWPDVLADVRTSVAPGYVAILDAATAALPDGTPMAARSRSRTLTPE